MKLADASAARVDFEKLTDCLLSKSHPVGKSNAAFFGQLGLSHDRPEALLAALLEVARSESVVDRSLTPFAQLVSSSETRPRPGW